MRLARASLCSARSEGLIGIGGSQCFSGSDLCPSRNNYCPVSNTTFPKLEYLCAFFFFFFNPSDNESLDLGQLHGIRSWQELVA